MMMAMMMIIIIKGILNNKNNKTQANVTVIFTHKFKLNVAL
jgi:hypothetical protein